MIHSQSTLIRAFMLDWYDAHARTLPWRSKPHERSDPYHVWLSEVMLQQTTVQAVMPYFEKFIAIWPSVNDLAQASQEDILREWAGLGYYSRARNLYKCAVMIANDYEGRFPADIKSLKALPGIGDYTSAAIASIAFDIPATVIDGNVERVVSRLYRIQTPLPDSKSEIRSYADHLFIGENQDRPSCFAQSLMDLGATICTPKSPKCMICPINSHCAAYGAGDAENYPIKAKKKALPERHALAFIYRHNGTIGIERREEKGMLGGMIGFPTSEWVDVSVDLNLSFLRKQESQENLQEIPAEVYPPRKRGAGMTHNKITPQKNKKIRHVFTHFALTLYPVVIEQETDKMIPFDEVETIGLPTLFKKLWNMIKSDL